MSGPRERDPLSVRYDAAAERAVTTAIQAGGQWVEIELKPPGLDASNLLYQSAGLWPWAPGRPGEYAWMTAFRRACYYDDRIYLHDKGNWQERNPMRTHALAWGGWSGRRTLLGRARAVARMRVWSIQAAHAYAAGEKPYFG